MSQSLRSLRSLSAALSPLALALLAPFAVGCAGEPGDEVTEEEALSVGQEIVGGSATSDYAEVGALTQFGQAFCTATVIAPRVAVTAAHCLDGVSARSIRFVLGPRAARPSAQIAVAQVAMHPSYDPFQIVHDIGVVVLASDAPVTPAAWGTTMDRTWVGRNVTFVGYGATNGFTGSGGGTKRAVTIPISQMGGSQFAYQDRTKNTCFGDSGGPAFFVDARGVRSVVGVTSFGDETCSTFGVDTRVDVYRSFVQPFVTATTPR